MSELGQFVQFYFSASIFLGVYLSAVMVELPTQYKYLRFYLAANCIYTCQWNPDISLFSMGPGSQNGEEAEATRQKHGFRRIVVTLSYTCDYLWERMCVREVKDGVYLN